MVKRKISLKQWIIIDCLAACLLAAVWLLLFMPVRVTIDYSDLDGSKVYRTATIAVKVGDLIDKRYPDLTDKDIVRPGRDTMVKKGMKITVVKGQEKTAEICGENKKLYLMPVTVEKNLKDNGIKYDGDDIVIPAPDRKTTSATNIVVKDVVVRRVNREKKVPAKFEARLDPGVSSGSIVTTEKRDGRGLFRYSTTYVNGKKKGVKVKRLKWIRKPVNGRKSFGTSLTGQRGRIEYTKVFTSESTAYTERKGSRGAAGGTCVYGTCAVDPSKIPYGTELYVEGYGFALANDCGGAIDGNDLDLYMNSESACNRWGRRYVKVYVLSNADRVTVKLDKEETE